MPVRTSCSCNKSAHSTFHYQADQGKLYIVLEKCARSKALVTRGSPCTCLTSTSMIVEQRRLLCLFFFSHWHSFILTKAAKSQAPPVYPSNSMEASPLCFNYTSFAPKSKWHECRYLLSSVFQAKKIKMSFIGNRHLQDCNTN